MSVRVRVIGAEQAARRMNDMADGAKRAGGMRVLIGSILVYAFGQETGRHRGGRLARRDGGVWYLTNSLRAVVARIKPAVAAAIPRGHDAVRQALLRLGLDVQRGGQQRAPVREGTLRRSIHTVQEGG